MLDDDHRIAEVAQALQRLQQPRIVPLVETDGGLIQHIEHAGEARADLRCQPNTLALAAGKRAGRAGKGEIIQAHIHEEAQTLANFLQDARCDLVLLGVEGRRQSLEPFGRTAHGQFAHLADMPPGHLHGKRLGLQTEAMAGGAGHR